MHENNKCHCIIIQELWSTPLHRGTHSRYETWSKRRNSPRWARGGGRAAFLTERLRKDQVVLYSLEPQPKVVQILKDKAYVQIHCSLYREFSPSCVCVCFSPFFFSFLYFFSFIFISWRLITLQYCSGFSIHWHESAMDLHVFPIPIPSPASLPIPSLWVFQVSYQQCRKVPLKNTNLSIKKWNRMTFQT